VGGVRVPYMGVGVTRNFRKRVLTRLLGCIGNLAIVVGLLGL